MDEITLKALLQSIEHWERLASGKRLNDEVVNRVWCALCTEFWDGGDCAMCPVREKTGKATCSNTPYGDAWYAAKIDGLDSTKFKEAAQKELDFLKSLLPQP